MSEQRFEVDVDHLLSVWDTEKNKRLEIEDIVDLLNEQQELIEELHISDEMGWKRAERFEKKCPKELHNKKMYIKRLEYKVQKFKEENEALKKFIKDNFSEMMDSKMVIDEVSKSEPFKFNKNCAKPYEIRSVSPNGVVRVGKKNSKVSWRMKDVREISAELPPFEDFNRETLQGISNKFHTKFDNDVIGRIIYNIYSGTFEEYI